MVRDLGRLDVRLGGQRLRQPGMDASTLSGHQAAVDRVDEQRVGQLCVVPGAGPEEPASGQHPKSRVDRLGLHAAGISQQPRPKTPLGDAEQPRQPPRALVQVTDAPVEQGRKVLGQLAVARVPASWAV